jgi:DNA-binding transcriptional LysR family regulator
MLSPRELQVFLASAETENFSEAARRLNVSQPAISMQIKSLEEKLGMPLFVRTGRQVSLTEAGHALVPMARDVIQQTIRLEEAMASLQGEVVGVLRIGCSTAAGKYVLPKLLAGLHEKHPKVTLVCDVTTRYEALEKLRSGEVQVAMTSLREHYKGIEYRPFLTDRIILIVPPGHPWAQRAEPIKPEELAEEKFILREEGSGTRESLREGLAWHDLSIDELQTIMTLGNSEAIRGAVAEGIGIAFISWMAACEGVGAGSVVAVEVADLELKRTLWMARDSDRPATRAQAAFWAHAFSAETEDLRRLPEGPCRT